MSISKNEILKLIKEVKREMDEAAPPAAAPAPAAGAPATAAPAAKNTAPAAGQPAAVAVPAAGLPVIQGFSDFLFVSKHPQYAALKPWLQSLGVKVK